MSPKQTDPSAVVVPFGKHKGATVAELLAKDPAYADWVMAQGWVAERFAELHAAIATRGAGTDDTPEHNALQARFLDAGFRIATLCIVARDEIAEDKRQTIHWARQDIEDTIKNTSSNLENAVFRLNECRRATGGWMQEQLPTAEKDYARCAEAQRAAAERLSEFREADFGIETVVEFEKSGIDAVVKWGHGRQGAKFHPEDMKKIKVELKPTMGDDYPTVMRQMQRLGASTCVVGQYTGRGVSEPQLRQMFAVSGFTLVFVQEIEEELRRSV